MNSQIAIRLLKHSLTVLAALMLGWALAPSPAEAQVIQRGIQGGVTGAIIGGILGGGKGAGRGRRARRGRGVLRCHLCRQIDSPRYTGGPPPFHLVTTRNRPAQPATIRFRGRVLVSAAEASAVPYSNRCRSSGTVAAFSRLLIRHGGYPAPKRRRRSNSHLHVEMDLADRSCPVKLERDAKVMLVACVVAGWLPHHAWRCRRRILPSRQGARHLMKFVCARQSLGARW